MTIFQLKLCPFCGGRPHVNYCVDYSIISCSCGIGTRENRQGVDTLKRIETLADEWNRRIQQTSSENTIEYRYRDWGEK